MKLHDQVVNHYQKPVRKRKRKKQARVKRSMQRQSRKANR